jgi:hypothetical protein
MDGAVRAEADAVLAPSGLVARRLALPTAVNHVPVSYTDGMNLSKPFGSWHASFHPVAALLAAESPRQLSQPPQVIEAQPLPSVAVFRNGIAHRGHVISSKGVAYTNGGCLWGFTAPHAFPTLPPAAESAAAVVVPLCDEWCKGYYHFTHEHLPRLALVHDALLRFRNVTVMLAAAPNAFQRQFLFDVLRIPRARVAWGRTVAAPVALYPTAMRCGNTFTAVLHLLRRIVFRSLALAPPAGRHLRGEGAADDPFVFLFAERNKLSRMPSNYHALKAELVAHVARKHAGKVRFVTTKGRENATAQVGMFYDADVVLGPHGANLANMMFMRGGTHVIEMASYAKGNLCYYSTAARVGVTHHLAMHRRGKDDTYTLPFAVLRDHVDHALRRLQRHDDDGST